MSRPAATLQELAMKASKRVSYTVKIDIGTILLAIAGLVRAVGFLTTLIK